MTDAITTDEWATIIESLGYSLERIRGYDPGEGFRESYEPIRREKMNRLQAAKTKASGQRKAAPTRT